MGAAKAVQDELLGIPDFGIDDEGLFAAEYKLIGSFKKAIPMVAGAAVQKLMMELTKEQEVLMNITDMAIDAYTAESIVLRVHKRISQMGEADQEEYKAMAQVYVHDAADRINKAGKEALLAFAEGDELRIMLMGMKRFTKTQPLNIKNMRRSVAEKLIADNKYRF
tara:strand:- start:89 stop:586 length:498 start_codon:yes stop_codon:yes gene_type:complete